jgi:hypothetical protein
VTWGQKAKSMVFTEDLDSQLRAAFYFHQAGDTAITNG